MIVFFKTKPFLFIIFFEHPASLAKTSVEQSIASAITFGKDSECEVNKSKSIPL